MALSSKLTIDIKVVVAEFPVYSFFDFIFFLINKIGQIIRTALIKNTKTSEIL